MTAVGSLSFAYRSPAGHIALETAATIVALLTAYLVSGRFRHTGRLNDLLLAAALGMFACTNLLFALPSALSALGPNTYTTWATLAGTLLAGFLLVVAAFASGRVVRHRGRAAVRVGAACALALSLVGTAMLFASPHLPAGIDPGLSPEASRWPHPVGQPAILGVELLLAVLLLASSFAFSIRGRKEADGFLQWLAAGAAVGAIGRVNYFLFPSLYSNWLSTGDVLRFTFYVLLFVGAMREIDSYQRRLANAAVAEERRRLARDLHDGLAQELDYIEAQARSLARRQDAGAVERIIRAAERAREESRRAINALITKGDEPLPEILTQAARGMATQVDATVELDFEPGVDVPPPARAALLRIMCEAIRNADRHGRADRILVALTNKHGVSLRIIDDGLGFDPTATRPTTGFGLLSMKERMESVGGSLQLDSTRGGGTRVEARLP